LAFSFYGLTGSGFCVVNWLYQDQCQQKWAVRTVRDYERKLQKQVADAKAKLTEAAIRKQQQRKLVAMEIQETSAVDHPAHLAEGWLVMKEAATAPECTDESHAAMDGGAHFLDGMEEASAIANQYDPWTGTGIGDLKPGSKVLMKGVEDHAVIGRAACGHLYMVSDITPGGASA
jgi:hypothetical protein